MLRIIGMGYHDHSFIFDFYAPFSYNVYPGTGIQYYVPGFHFSRSIFKRQIITWIKPDGKTSITLDIFRTPNEQTVFQGFNTDEKVLHPEIILSRIYLEVVIFTGKCFLIPLLIQSVQGMNVIAAFRFTLVGPRGFLVK